LSKNCPKASGFRSRPEPLTTLSKRRVEPSYQYALGCQPSWRRFFSTISPSCLVGYHGRSTCNQPPHPF